MSHDQDNRSNQLNPNSDAYWSSRGSSGGPRGRDFDDDDDPNHPYNQNPMKPGIGFEGIGDYSFPVPVPSKEDQEKQRRIKEFQAKFLEVAKTVIKPEVDNCVSRLRGLGCNAKAELFETVERRVECPCVVFDFGRFMGCSSNPQVVFSCHCSLFRTGETIRSGITYTDEVEIYIVRLVPLKNFSELSWPAEEERIVTTLEKITSRFVSDVLESAAKNYLAQIGIAF